MEGTAIHVDPVAAMLNPATGVETAHMIVAATRWLDPGKTGTAVPAVGCHLP